jgi:hypothetical protein
MDEKELVDAIFQVKMDATNINLAYEDATTVDSYLKQANEYLAHAKSEPNKREESIRAGLDFVGRARGILGQSSVQPHSFRRHQGPFLPPGTD